MSYETDYNNHKLKECLGDIGDMFEGLKTPLSKYLGGENGIVSDEKVTELANRIIAKQCRLFGFNVGIDGLRKRHIELLCYLVLRAFDPDDSLIDFSDFLDDAKVLDKSGGTIRHVVFESLNYAYSGGIHRSSVINRIRDSCRLLTGRSIADDYTKDEIRTMNKACSETDKKARSLQKKKEKLEANIASFQNTVNGNTDSIVERYKDYGIEGTDDYIEALDNKFFYNYGDLMGYYTNDKEPVNSYSRKLGRHRTDKEEKQWQEHRNELEEKWKQSFENPEDYLNAYKEFLEINALVDEFLGEHTFMDCVNEILTEDGYDITKDCQNFPKYYSELCRILHIIKRRR